MTGPLGLAGCAVRGCETKLLVQESQSARTHSVFSNTTSLPSGIYLYRLQVGDYVETKRMVVVK